MTLRDKDVGTIVKPWELWTTPEDWASAGESVARLGVFGRPVALVKKDPNGEIAIWVEDQRVLRGNSYGNVSEAELFKASKSMKQAKALADKMLRQKGYKLRNFMYEFPRRASAVDAVVFGLEGESLRVLLIQRKDEPFQHSWALPGGFIDEALNETADMAVRRELLEETNLTDIYFEQLYTFSEPDRDPREPVLSLSYFALVGAAQYNPKPGSDASEAQWFDVGYLPPLAFDHAKIIKAGLARLAGKVRYQPVGFELLPKEFTLRQLQAMYEAILQKPIDKRNFRNKILKMGVLQPLGSRGAKKVIATGKRPAQLYSFNRKEYKQLVKAGFNFEV